MAGTTKLLGQSGGRPLAFVGTHLCAVDETSNYSDVFSRVSKKNQRLATGRVETRRKDFRGRRVKPPPGDYQLIGIN